MKKFFAKLWCLFTDHTPAPRIHENGVKFVLERRELRICKRCGAVFAGEDLCGIK